jgi:hypothetical protein
MKGTMRKAMMWALAFASGAGAMVGDWSSYTPLYEIRAFAEAKGFLFAATGGGIRKVNPATRAETAYRNQEGLRDVGINALATSPEGEVYAASELGFLYRYDWGADAWEVLEAGYKGAGWRMNRRALVYRSGYLVLGSDKGLSFFNVKRRVAEANVTKLGSASGVSVNSLLFAGDTLFVGCNLGIFRAVLHLDRLLTDTQINIFNPAIWTRVVSGGLYYDPSLPADSTEAAADTGLHLPPDPVKDRAHSVLYRGPLGIASDYEGVVLEDPPARISPYRSTFRVQGKEYPNSFAIPIIGRAGGRWFVGGVRDMFELVFRDTVEYGVLRNPKSLPYTPMSLVRANRYGVFGLANPIVYRLAGNAWDSTALFEGVGDPDEWPRRGLRNFDAFAPGVFVAGQWGGGVQIMRDGRQTRFDARNSCLISSVPQDSNYVAVTAMARYRDRGYFIATFVENEKYRLAYLDMDSRKVACLPLGERGQMGRSLQVVGDTLLAAVTEKGVEGYRIRDEGGPVSIEAGNLLARLPEPPEPTLAGSADAFGNFWVTTEGASLLYVPGLATRPDSAKRFLTLDGFSGVACKNLESDPQGHLWTGCTEGGVFEVIPGRDTTLHTFRKYGLNDGLLSETIFNLTVNPDNGDIWLATEKGIARYESASRPTRSDLSGLKAYPNPFLSKHRAVVFDRLAAGSVLEVMTQSGEVVFRRSLAKSGTGDQIQWDGRNSAGRRVTEGVYFYVVKSSKESKRGKLIVAR